MPALSGYEIMGKLRPVLAGPPYLSVIVVTADVTPEAKRRALSLGASDFVTKPVDAIEVLLRTANLLRVSHLQRSLGALVVERTAQLDRAREETLACLACAAEYRDDITLRHTERVGRTAGLIATELGLPGPDVDLIRLAAPLHDVGKLGVPDSILLKPGALTAEETRLMREHVEIGAQILSRGSSTELVLARDIALYHHERWDGRGYCRGLAGPAIPLAARITAVADTFDALVHARPYKPAVALPRAVAIVAEESGRQFDPDVVRAFLTLEHNRLVHDGDLLARAA
jgi:putative two-component system response regulator